MTYELINILTTNTLGAFDNAGEALREYETIVRADDPENGDAYAVVAFDDQGEAQEVIAGPTANRAAVLQLVG
jgi:hypothetical protein